MVGAPEATFVSGKQGVLEPVGLGNNKFEIRNPKSETMTKIQNPNAQNDEQHKVLNFCHLNFEFVSSFDIRVSDLLTTPPRTRLIILIGRSGAYHESRSYRV